MTGNGNSNGNVRHGHGDPCWEDRREHTGHDEHAGRDERDAHGERGEGPEPDPGGGHAGHGGHGGRAERDERGGDRDLRARPGARPHSQPAGTPDGTPDGVPSAEERDLALLEELRAAARRLDPIPANALAAARASLDLRRLDAWLAELTGDTVVDERPLAGVRGEAPRLLTFEADGLTVEVEVAGTPGGARILGQLVPPQPASIEVHHRGGVAETSADDLGRFSATDLARGPARLLCTLTGDAAGRTIRTDWVVI